VTRSRGSHLWLWFGGRTVDAAVTQCALRLTVNWVLVAPKGETKMTEPQAAAQGPSTQPEIGAPPGAIAVQASIAGNTEYVSGCSIVALPQEILIACMRSRAAMVPFPSMPGASAAQPFMEWFMTIAMSPTMAKTLLLSLQVVIASYEKNNGAIPMDPGFRIETSGASPAAL
jgi:hypothetical protein